MAKKLWHNLLRSGKKKYYIRGTSTNVNGTETFNIQFIDDSALQPYPAETITCAVDAQGNWEYAYSGKKVYSLIGFARRNTTLLEVDFTYADDFNALTSLGTYAYGAFQNCTALVKVEFGNRTLENVLSCGWTFSGCSQLTYVGLNSATLNSCTILQEMFMGCSSLSQISLNCNFSLVMNATSMFEGCTVLTNVDFSNSTFASLTTATRMFRSCIALESVDISGATFSNITTMEGMFRGCQNLTDIYWSANLNLSNLKIAGSYYYGMFQGCLALTSLSSMFLNQNFTALETAENMFAGCSALTTPLKNQAFNKVKTFTTMYNGCVSLAEVDMSSTTFADTTSLLGMFSGCTTLQRVKFGNAAFAKVTNMNSVFKGCTALETVGTTTGTADFSHATFDVLSNANEAFRGTKFNIVDLSGATFDNLVNAQSMFYNCKMSSIIFHPNKTFAALKIAGGPNVDFGMFGACGNLTALDLTNVEFANVGDARGMLMNCSNLTSILVNKQGTAMKPQNRTDNNLNLADRIVIVLSYSNIVDIANWLSDMTGFTAHTLTLATSVWNTLSAAEQDNIDAILTAKNWIRAIA